MKKLIFVLILFSCSTAEKVAPVFTAIDGLWKISAKNVEAEFYLITVTNKQYVDNKGWIKINGIKHDIIARMQIPEIHPAPLRLQIAAEKARIDLTALGNSEFNKMQSTSYSYSVLGATWTTTTVNEPLTITR